VPDERPLHRSPVRDSTGVLPRGLPAAVVSHGDRVQIVDEPLIRVVSLSPGGKSAEHPDCDYERNSQEQQSGDEPKASARGIPYFFRPPP
jgi:hypothetical protein